MTMLALLLFLQIGFKIKKQNITTLSFDPRFGFDMCLIITRLVILVIFLKKFLKTLLFVFWSPNSRVRRQAPHIKTSDSWDTSWVSNSPAQF